VLLKQEEEEQEAMFIHGEQEERPTDYGDPGGLFDTPTLASNACTLLWAS
jgi:hypothetical protein